MIKTWHTLTHTHREDRDVDLSAQLGEQFHDNLIRALGRGSVNCCWHSTKAAGTIQLGMSKTDRYRGRERGREKVKGNVMLWHVLLGLCLLLLLPLAAPVERPNAVHFRR